MIGKIRDWYGSKFGGIRGAPTVPGTGSRPGIDEADVTPERQQILETERRSGADRRAAPTPAVGSYWLRGKRMYLRREAEIGSGYYVDHPGRTALFAVGTLAMLVVLDGVLTLYLIERGAFEANPVMAFFLSLGVPVFLSVKYGVTLVALAVLLIHKNFAVVHPRLRVKWIIVALISVYGALVVYEVIAAIALKLG